PSKTIPLFLTPKMGLIPEVSAQNYETLAKALREYVSNALDAEAQNVWMVFSADAAGASQLHIRDDGRGMSLDDLRDQFLAVGGSRKFDDPKTVGRIGIGFLAIVPLCDTITIYTKSRNERVAVRAVIDTNTMLPAGVRYDEIAKAQIGEAEPLSDNETRRLVDTWGDSFTSFSLDHLRGDVSQTFSDNAAFEDFRDELRIILPLPWPTSAHLRVSLSTALWNMLAKKAGAHAVKVFLYDSETPLTCRA